jgi:hypothetical protein
MEAVAVATVLEATAATRMVAVVGVAVLAVAAVGTSLSKRRSTVLLIGGRGCRLRVDCWQEKPS